MLQLFSGQAFHDVSAVKKRNDRVREAIERSVDKKSLVLSIPFAIRIQVIGNPKTLKRPFPIHWESKKETIYSSGCFFMESVVS
jgi:hypothetical protein